MGMSRILVFALLGALVAARRDFANYRSWNSANGARFDWSRAAVSWIEGGVLGALAALGLENVPGAEGLLGG